MEEPLKIHTKSEKIREGERCEGCKKLFKHPRRSLVYFAGRHVCRSCQRRKNMPLVGYTNKVKWHSERRIINKDRPMPYISWEEQKLIWRECMKRGMSPSEAKSKINSIKFAVRRNHWAYQKQQPTEPKKILPC